MVIYNLAGHAGEKVSFALISVIGSTATAARLTVRLYVKDDNSRYAAVKRIQFAMVQAGGRDRTPTGFTQLPME